MYFVLLIYMYKCSVIYIYIKICAYRIVATLEPWENYPLIILVIMFGWKLQN